MRCFPLKGGVMMFAEDYTAARKQDAAALRRAEISYWNYWTCLQPGLEQCGLAQHPEIILLTLLGKVDY